MTWAVSIEGRYDSGAILLLVETQEEAESLAQDIRRGGVRVVARSVHEPRSRVAMGCSGVL
jgi:hypothetical protein